MKLWLQLVLDVPGLGPREMEMTIPATMLPAGANRTTLRNDRTLSTLVESIVSMVLDDPTLGDENQRAFLQRISLGGCLLLRAIVTEINRVSRFCCIGGAIPRSGFRTLTMRQTGTGDPSSHLWMSYGH